MTCEAERPSAHRTALDRDHAATERMTVWGQKCGSKLVERTVSPEEGASSCSPPSDGLGPVAKLEGCVLARVCHGVRHREQHRHRAGAGRSDQEQTRSRLLDKQVAVGRRAAALGCREVSNSYPANDDAIAPIEIMKSEKQFLFRAGIEHADLIARNAHRTQALAPRGRKLPASGCPAREQSSRDRGGSRQQSQRG